MTQAKLLRKTTCQRTPQQLLENENKVWEYICYKTKTRHTKKGNISKKGVELRYNKVGKRCNLTYNQVRRIFDKLVKTGKLEKWSYMSALSCRINMYRIKN